MTDAYRSAPEHPRDTGLEYKLVWIDGDELSSWSSFKDWVGYVERALNEHALDGWRPVSFHWGRTDIILLERTRRP